MLIALLAFMAGAAPSPMERLCAVEYPDDPKEYATCVNPPKPPPPLPFEDWVRETLKPMGWSFLVVVENLVIYTRPGPARLGKTRMIWSRWETRDTANPTVVSLSEVDCGSGMVRFTQQTTYTLNNMGGKQASANFVDAWQYPIPDTTLAAIAKKACEK